MTDPQAPYRNASFLQGVPHGVRLPPDGGREVAFAGRSNSGKSSAINTITGKRGLARTSKTPGRTQHINFFDLGEDRRLVDLPGYGYAKVPEAMRREWRPLIENYLHQRGSLKGLILTVDCRRSPTEQEELLLDWCAEGGMPVHILLTKSDKLGRGAARDALRVWQDVLRDRGEPANSVQLFSSLTRAGLEDARARIEEWLGVTEAAIGGA